MCSCMARSHKPQAAEEGALSHTVPNCRKAFLVCPVSERLPHTNLQLAEGKLKLSRSPILVQTGSF